VLLQWVEARNNDLRQGNTWSIDTLIALLEDHLRHQDVEPVKTFISVAKTAEENRVLTRLKGRGNSTDTTPSALSLLTRNNNRPPKRTPQPIGRCDHCRREHLGPNLCWKAYPELIPDDVKKKRAETAAQKAAAAAAAARTNVTVNSNDDEQYDSDQYEAHNYVTIASFVSPNLLKKAITCQTELRGRNREASGLCS
jgi:hypothetical protein